MWHFQVEIGSLWDRQYKAWTNVTTFLLVTYIQLERVTYIHILFKTTYVNMSYLYYGNHFITLWMYVKYMECKTGIAPGGGGYFTTSLGRGIQIKNGPNQI